MSSRLLPKADAECCLPRPARVDNRNPKNGDCVMVFEFVSFLSVCIFIHVVPLFVFSHGLFCCFNRSTTKALNVKKEFFFFSIYVMRCAIWPRAFRKRESVSTGRS
jgi:hypothetical protein